MHAFRRCGAAILAASTVSLVGLISAARGFADDNCGPDMYFNIDTNQCEYYAIIGPVGPGPVGPGPVGPGPVGPGPVGPGPVGPGR